MDQPTVYAVCDTIKTWHFVPLQALSWVKNLSHSHVGILDMLYSDPKLVVWPISCFYAGYGSVGQFTHHTSYHIKSISNPYFGMNIHWPAHFAQVGQWIQWIHLLLSTWRGRSPGTEPWSLVAWSRGTRGPRMPSYWFNGHWWVDLAMKNGWFFQFVFR